MPTCEDASSGDVNGALASVFRQAHWCPDLHRNPQHRRLTTERSQRPRLIHHFKDL
jgi:hypothetical protein